MKYSSDGKVCFDPEKHTYTKDGKILKGVTTLISSYKNYFDKNLQANKYAEKHGLVMEDVLLDWEKKGKESRDQGTAVHKVFEDYINTGEIVISGLYEKEKHAAKFIKDFFFTGRLIPVETEMIVYNDSIASQIDFIAKTDKGDHFIFDPKTNKAIEKNSYGKYMKAPFNNLPDASFYHYSIQVSIYKILCTKYDIKQCFIVHITDNGYEIIKPESIKIPNNIINF